MHMKDLPNYKSKCGCRKADDLIHRFDMVDIISIYPLDNPKASEVVLRLIVGKTISGNEILEPIEYCPFCGNRFDGLIEK